MLKVGQECFSAGDQVVLLAGAGRSDDALNLVRKPMCFVPGVMEALKPGKDESHASTEEVPA